jgi:hypothetical protein
VSGYLELAKKVARQAAVAVAEKGFAERRQRKIEEAGRRGLVVRWSTYPIWIALHDP